MQVIKEFNLLVPDEVSHIFDGSHPEYEDFALFTLFVLARMQSEDRMLTTSKNFCFTVALLFSEFTRKCAEIYQLKSTGFSISQTSFKLIAHTVDSLRHEISVMYQDLLAESKLSKEFRKGFGKKFRPDDEDERFANTYYTLFQLAALGYTLIVTSKQLTTQEKDVNRLIRQLASECGHYPNRLFTKQFFHEVEDGTTFRLSNKMHELHLGRSITDLFRAIMPLFDLTPFVLQYAIITTSQAKV